MTAAPPPLFNIIARQIRQTGPITVAQYMALCLGHPAHGYYMTRDPLGARGDFTTAPEISQIFGELIGLWCVQVWRDQGMPTPVSLIELGPGRGTLMADVLRAARLDPAFSAAVTVHLVETSPVLRAAQEKTLLPSRTPVIWHEMPGTVPENGFSLILANEFFDALPIRQFVHTPQGWYERHIGLDPPETGLTFALAPLNPAVTALIPPPLLKSPPGSIVEVSPAGIGIAAEIATRIGSAGAALIIDYGHMAAAQAAQQGLTSPLGETLQAIQDQRIADPLATPGEADLTAHVDFSQLAASALDAAPVVATTASGQGAFLNALGIGMRRDALIKHSPDQATGITNAVDRLIDPDGMGQLFKVMGLRPRTVTPLPGLE